jgi:hypothetical protein
LDLAMVSWEKKSIGNKSKNKYFELYQNKKVCVSKDTINQIKGKCKMEANILQIIYLIYII